MSPLENIDWKNLPKFLTGFGLFIHVSLCPKYLKLHIIHFDVFLVSVSTDRYPKKPKQGFDFV